MNWNERIIWSYLSQLCVPKHSYIIKESNQKTEDKKLEVWKIKILYNKYSHFDISP